MDKNMTETTLSTNYGDFLRSSVEKTKDQFSDEEYKTLTADAEKIRAIEEQIATLALADAAASGAAAQGTAFPQFEGSDLEGNPVDNSLFAGNAFTVVNFWFNGCKPCVEELDDLNALNEKVKAQGGEVVGNHTRVKIVKNKVAPPFKEAEFDIMFGQGISKEGDILDLAADAGIINKSGAWYAYNGEKIGQGRENAKNYLKENPLICEEVEAKVRAKYSPEEDEAAEQPDEKSAGKTTGRTPEELPAE